MSALYANAEPLSPVGIWRCNATPTGEGSRSPTRARVLPSTLGGPVVVPTCNVLTPRPRPPRVLSCSSQMLSPTRYAAAGSMTVPAGSLTARVAKTTSVQRSVSPIRSEAAVVRNVSPLRNDTALVRGVSPLRNDMAVVRGVSPLRNEVAISSSTALPATERAITRSGLLRANSVTCSSSPLRSSSALRSVQRLDSTVPTTVRTMASPGLQTSSITAPAVATTDGSVLLGTATSSSPSRNVIMPSSPARVCTVESSMSSSSSCVVPCTTSTVRSVTASPALVSRNSFSAPLSRSSSMGPAFVSCQPPVVLRSNSVCCTPRGGSLITTSCGGSIRTAPGSSSLITTSRGGSLITSARISSRSPSAAGSARIPLAARTLPSDSSFRDRLLQLAAEQEQIRLELSVGPLIKQAIAPSSSFRTIVASGAPVVASTASSPRLSHVSSSGGLSSTGVYPVSVSSGGGSCVTSAFGGSFVTSARGGSLVTAPGLPIAVGGSFALPSGGSMAPQMHLSSPPESIIERPMQASVVVPADIQLRFPTVPTAPVAPAAQLTPRQHQPQHSPRHLYGGSLYPPSIGTMSSPRQGLRQGVFPPSVGTTAASILTPSTHERALAVMPFYNKVDGAHYLPDTHDPIDVAVACTLWKLDPVSLSSISLRRIVPSKYEIEGRNVTVTWADDDKLDIHLCEDDVPECIWMPLLSYLQQAASVSMSMAKPRGNEPLYGYDVVAAPPAYNLETMSEEAVHRVASMQIACADADITPRILTIADLQQSFREKANKDMLFHM